MSGRNLRNRPQTARSTMAPISRGGRPTLENVPKKIAVSPAVYKSYSHVTIVSCRSRTPTPSGEAGHLVPVDRPRWSEARDTGISRVDLVCGTFIYVSIPQAEPDTVKHGISGRPSARSTHAGDPVRRPGIACGPAYDRHLLLICIQHPAVALEGRSFRGRPRSERDTGDRIAISFCGSQRDLMGISAVIQELEISLKNDCAKETISSIAPTRI